MAASRCRHDAHPFCVQHRGFEAGEPLEDLCLACEGLVEGARRDARACALDQEVAVDRLAQDPVRIATVVGRRGLRTSTGTTTRTVAGGWLKPDRTEVQQVPFWVVTREREGEQEVGLGLTSEGSWVRHVRHVGSRRPPVLERGVQPSPGGARGVVAWLEHHHVDLAELL